MRIRDWSVARELDVKATEYIRGELATREAEREKRDREFWVTAFGGKVPDPEDDIVLEDSMGRSALGHGYN